MAQEPLCVLTDIKKSYHVGEIDLEVLRGINLEIKRGEFIAIMGPSGSGKTTLLNIIGCLDRPTSGRYILLQKEVSRLSDDELSEIRNKHIGFVFQNFYLLPYATALENVLLPTLYRSSGPFADAYGGFFKDRKFFWQRAIQILRLVGLSDRARFKPNQLSGGQQQRVAIARALINDPDIILADEPTGQLDSSTAKEIMSLLKDLNTRGKTIILVTHDTNIASYATRIIHMKDGLITG